MIKAIFFDVEADEILYVGDSYEHDMKGAKAFGWNTVWMNRRGHSVPEEGCLLDKVAYTEEELHAALRRMIGKTQRSR